MESLATPKKTLEILRKRHFKFSKALGQNFLVDQNILNKIVEAADLSPQDVVLEIGAGIGTLTLALASKARAVLAVEFDRVLLSVLNETLKEVGNTKILAGDALKLNRKNLPVDTPQPNKMVSTLPYNIATALLSKYLQEYPELKLYVVTVQREVGQRITANPGSKDYGAFTLKIQFYCDAQIVFPVSRRVFIPEPKVDSAIIKLKRLPLPRVRVEHPDFMFKTITAAFGQRRKTLKNALVSSPLGSPEKIGAAIQMSGIDPKRRAETLTIEEFATLSQNLYQIV